jgi:phage terminase small subunit
MAYSPDHGASLPLNFFAREVVAMPERLTKKQEKFVSELIKGKSQREAYKAAYDTSRMKDSSVDVNASKLAKSAKVAQRLEELRTKVERKAEEKAVMSAVDVLREIEKIAKGDIADYLSFRTEKAIVGHDEETGEQIIRYVPIVDLKDSRTVDTKNIQEVSLGANGSFKFKMYSREAALYKLLDLYGTKAVDAAKLQLMRERLEMDKDINGKKYW